MPIITTDSQHYSNIADQIRAATNSDAEFYPAEMSERIAEVAKSSHDNAIRAMWECVQAGGTKVLSSAYVQDSVWTKETFKPIYDVRPTSCYLWSRNCPLHTMIDSNFTRESQIDIAELEREQGIVFDFSAATNFDYAFVGPLFKSWNVIDLTNAKAINGAFYGGYIESARRRELTPTRIERLICAETNTFGKGAFQYALSYEYIGFEGTIASDINLSWSPLVPESMKKAILCLKNYAGTENEFAYTITFSEDCWAALEADSKAPNGMGWREYVGSLGWNA